MKSCRIFTGLAFDRFNSVRYGPRYDIFPPAYGLDLWQTAQEGVHDGGIELGAAFAFDFLD